MVEPGLRRDQRPGRRSSSRAATAGSTRFDAEDRQADLEVRLQPEGRDLKLGGAGTRNDIIAHAGDLDDKVYIGVGQDPEHGEGVGHLWGIDATRDGDVTGKAVVWHRGGDEFHRTISTVAIADGIVYAADLSGHLYALDAKTGELFWTHDAFAADLGLALRGRRQGLPRRRGRRRRR